MFTRCVLLLAIALASWSHAAEPERPALNVNHQIALGRQGLTRRMSLVTGRDGQMRAAKFGASGALAHASFVPGAHTPSNMGHLEVVTLPGSPDLTQFRAAGWAEGYITAEHIAQHWANMWAFMNITQADGVLAFMEAQLAWLRAQMDSTQEVPFWDAIRALLAQFEGLYQGYNARAAELQQSQPITGVAQPPPLLSEAQMYFLCSLGDVSDIRTALAKQRADTTSTSSSSSHANGRQVRLPGQPAWDELSAHELAVELNTGDRCSALVKVAPDFSDMWVGQSAWYTYAAMLRVFKHYTFALTNPALVGRSLAFSSYYGQLSSDDDFYLVGPTQLVILQTTNRIMDESLLGLIQPHCVLSWQRVRAACAVARTGKEWAAAVATHNSGTYTNSWAVVSAGAFTPGQPLPAGLCWVVEQVPGTVFDADMTTMLENGYFALFNVPVLRETYQALGYPAFVQRMAARGPEYASAVEGVLRQLAPRAKIFRRDHPTVTDTPSMQGLMRSNNWKTDPFSKNMSTNAVCGRGDVDPVSPRAAGCYDAKVASWAEITQLAAHVVNGPPYSPDMPSFQWPGSMWNSQLSHVGQPDKFAFQWQAMQPDLAKWAGGAAGRQHTSASL